MTRRNIIGHIGSELEDTGRLGKQGHAQRRSMPKAPTVQVASPTEIRTINEAHAPAGA